MLSTDEKNLKKEKSTELSDRQRRGWHVTFAGFGTNMALGVLYSWGVFAAALRTEGWTATESQIPYMIACAMFALLMVPGGRLQDKYGPRPVITAAAGFALVGLVMSGFFTTVIGISIFFGLIFGTGIGFGYSSATPPAVKWFGSHKRGLIAGIVVSGFGLAGIYIAPLTRFLLAQFGLELTFVILGISLSIIVFVMARFITNPPEGYEPPKPTAKEDDISVKATSLNLGWNLITKTPHFYALWLMFFFGTFAGLMVIGQLQSIGEEQGGLTAGWATALVMVYAVSNCIGRIICGMLSDIMSRKLTMFSIFAIQAITFLFFIRFTNFTSLATATVLVAFAYGGMLSVFPATTADFYGLKHLGVNYGLVFTAWGASGVFGPLLGGIVRDVTGTYLICYLVAAGLSILGGILSLLTNPPSEERLTNLLEKYDH